jgi:hypothetical protein
MKALRIIIASALLTLPIALFARAPYTPPGAQDAVLRFSWRMTVTGAENCRQRTQAELDALPVHMRTLEECSRDRAGYVLVTRLDDGPADTLQLLRGGVKGDRPLFVLKERRLAPGMHHVTVELQRIVGSTAGAREASVLARLDTTLLLQAGRVQLVTLDEAGRNLLVRTSR